MAALTAWLVGRKTYLLFGLLALAFIYLSITGQLTPHACIVLVTIASFCFPATIKAALDRHHAESIQLATETAATLLALASRNVPMAISTGTDAAECGAELIQEIRAEVSRAPQGTMLPGPAVRAGNEASH